MIPVSRILYKKIKQSIKFRAFNQSVRFSSGSPAHARGEDGAGGVMLFAIQSLAEAASSAATKVGILRKENGGRKGGKRKEEEGGERKRRGREGGKERRRDGERRERGKTAELQL